ncbi:hypothetical protein SAMN05421688_2470 [Poseidonocella pacifica]|uniref:Capsular polysaccharide export protein n=1 Tax=Poseidonocella pacifica TaxID=871651 RepID=A0A1I0XVE2_9RHOB|nr:hypothetical protein [Poseidonocella pacifica]SFB04270.1 hypothetical protein SAMN05421688_2470 [Poseidonocella pacifica]
MTNRVERIVFTGDFLRPSVGEFRPTQHENIAWLARVLDAPVGMATGLPREIVHWDNNWLNGSRLDQGTVEAIYRSLWLEPNINSWPSVFDATALPDSVESLLAPLFENSFVIGFELPPYLLAILRRLGVGFVDCSLSPIRFLDDIVFTVAGEAEHVSAAIKRYEVLEDYVKLHAGVLASNVAKANPNPPRPNTLLLILQTVYDKVVISNGKFVSAYDYIDAFKEISADYQHVLIKEHPLEPQPNVRDQLLKNLKAASVTEENFYRLVGHQNVTGVAALSSSCVAEARYFGKTGHYVLPGFTESSSQSISGGSNIDDAVIMPDFWRDVLGAAGVTTSAKDGLRIPTKPNRFRQQLRAAWGFNQIDTDIPVEWARK